MKNKEIKENITRILAENYFQAASNDCDMFSITKILEEVRNLALESDDLTKVEDCIEIRLGENIDHDNEFGVVQQLQEQVRMLKREVYKAEIENTFKSNENAGWQKWLEAFGYELTKAIADNLNFLVSLKIPASKHEAFDKIKKLVPYVIKERWAESVPLFESISEMENIPATVKGELHILSAQIYLYHLWDMEKALKHIEKIKEIIPDSPKGERTLGEYYIQNNDFENARIHLQKALDIDKNDFENYLVLGNLYKAENRYETAENWYNEGIRKNPGKADLYNRILLLNEHEPYYKRHKKDIDSLLEKIIKLDTEFTFTALGNAGYVHQKNGNFEKAEDYYLRVIDLFPDRILGYINLAYSYLEKNDYEKAEEAFRKSLDKDTEAFDAYWGLVAMYRKKGEWNEVITNLKYCEKYRPEWNYYIYNDYGNAYEQIKDFDNALKYYLLALKNDPEKTFGLDALLKIAELDVPMEKGLTILKRIWEIKGRQFDEDYHYKSGSILFKNKQYADAAHHFEQSPKTIEGDPVKLEYLGLVYEKSGDFEKAEIAYQKAIDAAETDKDKYYNRLAFFLTNQNRCSKAIDLLNKAIEIKQEPLYFENRGYASEILGELENAESDYFKALNQAENNKDTYENRLGVFYYNQKKYDEAIQRYSNAIELFEKAVYYENIGLAYEYSGKIENAEESYRKALNIEEYEKDIYENRLGVYYYNLQNYGEAIQHYSKAINLNAKPVYHENIGLAFEHSGNHQKAEDNYRKALELAEANLDKYYNRLGFFLSVIGKYEESVEMLKKAIELNPLPTYFENLGFSLEKLGNLKEAETNYQKALEISPDQKDIYLNRIGIYYYNQKKYDQAIRYYKKAVEYQQKPVYYENLGNAYFDSEDYESAEKEFIKVLEITPQNYIYFENLGLISQKQQEYKKAIGYFEQALSLAPENEKGFFYNYIGNCWYSLDEWNKAAEFYRNAINRNPEQDVYFDNLILALKNNHQFDEAIKIIEAKLIDNPENNPLINQLGLFYIQTNEYIKAADCFKSYIKIEPTASLGYDNLAYVYELMHQYEDAVKVYLQALQLFPDKNVFIENFGKSLLNIPEEGKRKKYYSKAMNINGLDKSRFSLLEEQL